MPIAVGPGGVLSQVPQGSRELPHVIGSDGRPGERYVEKQIQLKLSQLVGEPVVIQAVFLSGTPVEVGGTASPTPAPFATPTRFPTLKPTGTP